MKYRGMKGQKCSKRPGLNPNTFECLDVLPDIQLSSSQVTAVLTQLSLMFVSIWIGNDRRYTDTVRYADRVNWRVISRSISILRQWIAFYKYGGQGGIRTLGTLTSSHTFQACPFDHSGTCPKIESRCLNGGI